MAQQPFQIIHRKKNMQSLIRKLAYLQLFYVATGIFETDGKKPVFSRVAQWKREHPKTQREKSTKEKVEEELDEDDDGIHKTRKGRKRRITVATLAYLMEKSVSWIQPKTVCFSIPGVSEPFTIWKGANIKRPARIFISIHLLKDKWNKIRNNLRNRILELLAKRSIGVRSLKSFWKVLGKEANDTQKDAAIHSEHNSIVTEIIKNSSIPLLDSGKLMNSIKWKVIKQPNRSYEKIKNCKELYNLNDIMDKLSRK